MPDAQAASPPHPSPAGALEARFDAILRGPMRDVPMLNPVLRVQAVGFRPWSDHWLGVLITPWFMNLTLMPRVPERWHAIGERESRHHAFPAGVFEFIGSQDPELGDFQCCSLFSPMFEFADQAGAHATAVAALAALFDAGQPEAVAAPPAPAPVPRPLSKRDFLRGAPPRPDHGT